jgi:hypothetical protein
MTTKILLTLAIVLMTLVAIVGVALIPGWIGLAVVVLAGYPFARTVGEMLAAVWETDPLAE